MDISNELLLKLDNLALKAAFEASENEYKGPDSWALVFACDPETIRALVREIHHLRYQHAEMTNEVKELRFRIEGLEK